MVEKGIYLEKLSIFADCLRQEGFAVGLQETADAAQVLSALGLADREQVKTALMTVFAKSREEQLSFEGIFDNFFLSEKAILQRAELRMEQQRQLQEAKRAAQEDFDFYGQTVELTDAQQEVYVSMPQEARDKLHKIMERWKESYTRKPELYGSFIHSVFTRTILEEQMRMEDAGVGCWDSDPEIGLLYRDISQFQDKDIPKAIDMIRNITQQLNGELTAKRRARGHAGKLDFRRTFRKGLETGGSFYRLAYKKKRNRRKHLVLLCDVSASMIQFSEFALRFIQALDHVSESSRTFLFSEDMVEADAFSLQNMDLFRNYVRSTGIYGRGTDIGAALERLCAMQPASLNAATTLLILSDAKTVDEQRALYWLQEAKRKAGRVLWLNPIPENKWPYLRSTQIFSSFCAMISCSTLSALASACRRLGGK